MTELGNRLIEAREAKGLSLDELQNITKIQKRYLIGIEEGNYAIMPGKFYVRAFIKQYAEAVDLNPEEIFELYKEEIPSVVNTDLPELSRVQSRKSISDGNSKVFDAIPKLLIAVFLLGASALIYYFFLQQSAGERSTEQLESGDEPVKYENVKKNVEEDNQNDKTTSEDNSTVEETDGNNSTDGKDEELSTLTQEVTVVSSNGSDTVYELKNTDRFELKLTSTGDTWVNMKNGKGYSLFQGMLKKGQTESHTVDYSKETEAVLVIGNSINTEIYINDQKIDYAIAPTDEVRQDIVIKFIPKVE